MRIPPGEEYFTDEELAKEQTFCDEMNVRFKGHRVITREEFEDYKLGWKYFREHFRSLWD